MRKDKELIKRKPWLRRIRESSAKEKSGQKRKRRRSLAKARFFVRPLHSKVVEQSYETPRDGQVV